MLPFFYHPTLSSTDKLIELPEETSKHIVQVLRMQEKEQLQLTNGKGLLANAIIIAAHKKHCTVQLSTCTQATVSTKQNTIAIALLKNANRLEWFLEKATELGITQIIPLLTQRTEKQNFKYERMQQICVSAMLQSQQTFLPTLQEPIKFANFIKNTTTTTANKLIAHCYEDQAKKTILAAATNNNILLIGPEGDFTKEEIALANENGFQNITLGSTRLRTETAAVAAATLLQLL